MSQQAHQGQPHRPSPPQQSQEEQYRQYQEYMAQQQQAPAASATDAGKSFVQMVAPWAAIGVLCYVFPVLSLFKLFGMIVCVPMAIIGCAVYGVVGAVVGAKNGANKLVSGATDAVKSRVGLGPKQPEQPQQQQHYQHPPQYQQRQQ